MSMLLGNKKTQGEEQNWCIVLTSLPNEIDRKRVARKISEAFSLSPEESADLVANTPIILLDNLTRSVAVKVKEYFHATGAEMMLTNDTLLKRKCYRTVWPEPPSLSFLHAWNEARDASQVPEPLEVQEALHEIQSLREEESNGQERPLETVGPEEFSGAEREKEIREMRVLLANAEERYEGLKEEYREARSLFEEKLSRAAQQTERERLYTAEALEKLQLLLNAKETLERTLNEQTEKLEHANEKCAALTRKLESVQLALEEGEALRAQAEERQRELEAARSRLMQELEAHLQESRHWEGRARELEKAIRELRDSTAAREKMLEAHREQLEVLERELESARRQLREMNVQIEQREATQKRTQLTQQLVEKEARLKALVKDQEKVETEIREREEAMRKVLAEQETLERDIVEAKQAQRHLLEQTRKDRAPRIKFTRSEGATPSQDPLAETP